LRDSYQRFLSEFEISELQFFDFGLKDIIYIPKEVAENEWEILKKKIQNNEEVFIRGFGRDAKGTYLYQKLYELLIDNNHVKKDPSNNTEPTKLMKQLTGFSKTKSSRHQILRNYQVAHVFGRTKNVYAFAAPWNLVYIPKIMDPFTGHEAKGEAVERFTALFQKQTYDKFSNLIDEFNEIMTSPIFLSSLDRAFYAMQKNSLIKNQDLSKLKDSIYSCEFLPIEIRQDTP
jgi:hypothetical protein